MAFFQHPEREKMAVIETLWEQQNQTQKQEPESGLEADEAKLEGNALFKQGKYEEALIKYDLALQLQTCICHTDRAACFSKLGRHKETVEECTKALELNPEYINALLRRSEAHEKLENFEAAIADMLKILEFDPSNDHARRAVIHLKHLADEKRETEMIGKFKAIGTILGEYGITFNDFKSVKDPRTGSYSISFWLGNVPAL